MAGVAAQTRRKVGIVRHLFTTHKYKNINHDCGSHIPEGKCHISKGKACFLVIEIIKIFMTNICISHVLKKVTYCSDVATGPLQGLLGCENMMIFYD